MYKKSQVLGALRTEMEAGNKYTVAVKRLKDKQYPMLSERTIDLWAEKIPRVKRYKITLMTRNDNIRDDIVEDGHFKKLAQGKGSAADYEFYLVNRRPNRWKKTNSDLIHKGEGGEGGGNVTVNVYPNRTTIFKDLKYDGNNGTGNTDAPKGAEGSRLAGSV